ncbi:MAG TPA: hypothetical protein ENN60_01035 [archaeon]|nr:hypothetical protein [archaeon]
MAWKNLKLFLVDSRRLQPDTIMKKLQQFRFNGQEGCQNFETWREFNEIRFQYLFVIPRYVRVSHLRGQKLEEEKVKMDTITAVEFHVRANGIVEAYGSPLLVERAMDAVSSLGRMEPITFSQKDFSRMMKTATDIRKVKIHGTGDEKVTEVVMKGSGLTDSGEVKKYIKTGKIREIQGKLNLRTGAFGFAMKENEVRFFIKNPESDQADMEFFVDMITSA